MEPCKFPIYDSAEAVVSWLEAHTMSDAWTAPQMEADGGTLQLESLWLHRGDTLQLRMHLCRPWRPGEGKERATAFAHVLGDVTGVPLPPNEETEKDDWWWQTPDLSAEQLRQLADRQDAWVATHPKYRCRRCGAVGSGDDHAGLCPACHATAPVSPHDEPSPQERREVFEFCETALRVVVLPQHDGLCEVTVRPWHVLGIRALLQLLPAMERKWSEIGAQTKPYVSSLAASLPALLVAEPDPGAPEPSLAPLPSTLSPRLRQIADGWRKGMTECEIAENLTIKPHSVHKRIGEMRKMWTPSVIPYHAPERAPKARGMGP